MMRKDWRYQVFFAIALTMIALWSTAPLQAATNVKLSGVMPAFGNITYFQISPDGRYAVYVADQDHGWGE